MTFWSDSKWRSFSTGSEPVQPFDGNRVEAANYLLSVGEEVYVSESETGAEVRKLSVSDDFFIDPGQFAFLLTHERIKVPKDVIGFISIRATIKFQGLVNISGFHVDPGYEGKLIFSVFNAGPARIHLKQGDAIFPLWFAGLDKPTQTKVKRGYENIPSHLLTPIAGQFVTAHQVAKQVVQVDSQVADVRRRLSSAEEEIARIRTKYIYAGIVGALVLLLFGDDLRNFGKDMVTRVKAITTLSDQSPSGNTSPSQQSPKQ